VAVEINAKTFSFIYYGGGIYDASDCYQEIYRPNHALTVIGYDYQLDFDGSGLMRNRAYWQMLNSFGTGWGENGYIRIGRVEGETGSGPCGMYKNPTYPVL
jgi:cathepsin L